jgi:hypothetical protein
MISFYLLDKDDVPYDTAVFTSDSLQYVPSRGGIIVLPNGKHYTVLTIAHYVQSNSISVFLEQK